VIEAVALIAEHVVGGVALDDAAGAGGIRESVALQVRAVQTECSGSQHSETRAIEETSSRSSLN